MLGNRNNGWLFAAGRLKDGVTADRAEESLTVLARQLAQALQPPPPPDAPLPRIPVTAFTLGDTEQRAQMVPAAALLLASVGAVLLIACANVANLLLSRAASRRHEIALRLALGASRWRLVRQLMTESLLLAGAGGLVGIALAGGLIRLLTSMLPPSSALPIAVDPELDGAVLLFGLVLSVVTGVVFGLLPALSASRLSVTPALKDAPGAASSIDPRPNRLGIKRGLVAAEVALSIVLLVAAGLFLRSLAKTTAINPGFDVDRLLSAPLNVNLLRYTKDQGREFYRRVIEDVGQIPGVEAAALARVAVLAGGRRVVGALVEGQSDRGSQFTSEGTSAQAAALESVTANVVSAGFFRTLGIPLLRGRDFRRPTSTAARTSLSSARQWRARGFRVRILSAGGSASAARTDRGERLSASFVTASMPRSAKGRSPSCTCPFPRTTRRA